MKRRISALVGVAAAVAGMAIVGVAVAGTANAAPSNVWVGTTKAVALDNNCLHPGFNSVQAAINAVSANGTVHICGGRYIEQLSITKGLTIVTQGSPVIALPANPANSTTACDTAIGSDFQPNQDGISICTSSTVKISALSVDAAWPEGTCYDSLYGIFAAGGVKLTLNNVSITGAGARPLNGCQGGVGLQVGTARTTPNEVGHLTMTSSFVSGYQKNGVDVVGLGTTGTITTSTVSGAGETPAIAQNGIQISDGASAMVSGDTITGNECDVSVCGADPLADTQSSGILLFGASPKTVIANNNLLDNDNGVYYIADPSGAKPTANLVIRGNHYTDNRYEGLVLDQGLANVTGDTYAGGNIAVSVIQYNGQTFGGVYTESNENMTGQSVAAIDISSDNAETGDLPGKLTLSNISKHGGAILNDSSNLVIVAHNVH